MSSGGGKDVMTGHASDPGSPVASERDAEIREAYKVVAAEIGKLRGLDLGDHHPAVVFRPLRKKESS